MGLIVVLLASFPARAAERPTIDLSYSRAEDASSCPDVGALRAKVIENVGYDPFVVGESGPTFTVEIEMWRRAQDLHATIRSTASGQARTERTIRSVGTDCNELASSVSLALAVMLDPDTAPRAPAQPPPAAPPAEPRVRLVPMLIPVRVETPSPAVPEPPSVEGVVTGAFTIGAGMVPAVSLGPSIGAGVHGELWEVTAEVTYILEGEATSDVGSVTVSSVYGSVVPCLTPRLWSTGVGLFCLTGNVGAAFVDAEGVSVPSPSTQIAGSIGTRAGLGWRLAGPLELRANAEVYIPVAPLKASIDDRGTEVEVYRSPAVGGRGSMGVAVHFP